MLECAITLHTVGEVQASPVSMVAAVQLQNKAVELYPDPEPPQKPVPHAADKSMMYPDTDDPLYKAELARARSLQNLYINVRLCDLTLRFEAKRRAALIEEYSDEVKRTLEYVAGHEDDWLNVLDFCVLRYRDDRKRVLHVATLAQPVTAEEERDGVRWFRSDV